jgi:copper chaperone
MIAFEVQDMTCGHCASTITKALKSADRGVKVTIDLSKHLVMVEPTEADEQQLHEAIAEAGYTPVRAEAASVEPVAQGGSCCGNCR